MRAKKTIDNLSSTDLEKFKVNDLASYAFLKKFCLNINLKSLDLNRLKNEIDNFSISEYYATQILEIFSKLQNIILENQELSCTKSEVQILYTDLLLALSNEEIILSKENNTAILCNCYIKLFDNSLDLITNIFNKMGYDKDQWTRNDCPTRYKKILGEKTLGIYDENGVEIRYYGLSHPESRWERTTNGVMGFNYNPQSYNNKPYIYTLNPYLGDSFTAR